MKMQFLNLNEETITSMQNPLCRGMRRRRNYLYLAH